MPTTTRKFPDAATRAGKTRKAAARPVPPDAAPLQATAAPKPRRKKKSADLVVVGPVDALPETAAVAADPPAAAQAPARSEAPALPAIFESGTRLSGIGNAFEVAFSGTGELVVRYQDRRSWFGPTLTVVVVSDSGRGQAVSVADLARNGAVHEGRIQLPPETAAVALAFAGNGRWDSNDSRNYLVRLRR